MLTAIARIEGTYAEKFGVPRQAGLVAEAKATITLLHPFNHPDFIRGIEAYSHLWLIFGFHQNLWHGEALVRPQRLGGNRKMGVLATRSPFRPNGLGLSAVKLLAVDAAFGQLEVGGHDLVNGTPIYDIKPYIPFVDAISEATSSFAGKAPNLYPVEFTETADKKLTAYPEAFRQLIIKVIAQNPTPPYHNQPDRIYGVLLDNVNILFQKQVIGFVVVDIQPL